jgi:hypothetical protein
VYLCGRNTQIDIICVFITRPLENTVVWDVLPCKFLDGHERFEGTCTLHLWGRNLPKENFGRFLQTPSTRVPEYSVTYQKAISFTAITENLKYHVIA